ncbi:AraC family transcriptional regulator (plasmid) [Qingshengfaniella alkalisoli]|uniref:AraC family transcriptional regulator n=1 Tax=Qingshengfaniella alkalisoli TaxID=2599296 RepID=A0A5B8JAU6_9RHOB|nr:AraC family transcriptional regulator [Qingshengfaniella alkalisoli]
MASLDVPASSVAVEDGPNGPYCAARLTIDQDILSELSAGLSRADRRDTAAFAVAATTPEFLDAWTRMLRLLDAPDEIETLAPLLEPEILFRVLQGSQGALLRQAARADSRIA